MFLSEGPHGHPINSVETPRLGLAGEGGRVVRVRVCAECVCVAGGGRGDARAMHPLVRLIDGRRLAIWLAAGTLT